MDKRDGAAPHRLLFLFIGVLIPLFVFGVLAEQVFDKEVFSFDRPILLFMHAHASALLDRVMMWASHAGSALALVPLALILAFWLYRRHERRRTLFWVLAVAGAAVLNFIAKLSFTRARPTLWVSILPETTFSFPSGHAMSTMAAVAAIMYLLHRRLAPGMFALALAAGSLFVGLVGISRIYLGVHYPSDVLAGWLASLAWVSGLAYFLRIR